MIAVKSISWTPPGAADAVLREVTFSLPEGAYAVMMGRTGGGKTSLLEILCGLRRADAGQIWMGGVEVTEREPRHRQVGYLPQDLALFPEMKVRRQVEFARRVRGALDPAATGALDSRTARSAENYARSASRPGR